MFVEDAKLPQDIVRKQYSDTRDALCFLNCGFEWDFDPTVQDSIGRPLCVGDARLQVDATRASTTRPASLHPHVNLPVRFRQG
jgi:hypothetical protein